MSPNTNKSSKKKRVGIGAVCCVQQRRLHPKKKVQELFYNSSNLDTLNNLLVTGIKNIKVNSKLQECITFRHDKLEDVELYCVKRWVNVVTEGAACHVFFNDQDDDIYDIEKNPNESNKSTHQNVIPSTETAITMPLPSTI